MKDMVVITARDVIRGVRDRFFSAYAHYRDDQEIGPSDNRVPVGVKRSRLKALDLETCSASDVDQAMSVTGWAENECDICSQNQERVVRLGDEPDYDARWLDVCSSCLSKALELSRSPQVSEGDNEH